MHARAVQRLRIGQRLGDAVAKLRLAPGQAGQASLAVLPVARRRVEQHLLQSVGLQPCRQLARLVGIGEQELHALEAVARGGFEAVEEIELGVEHGQVGGKAGHEFFLRYQRAPKLGAVRRSAIRSAARSRAAASSVSRAVSSSSSSTAIAAAGVSCQTLGPRRCSITARIGAPVAAVVRDQLRHFLGSRERAGTPVADQRHMADFHHEVGRDRRQQFGRPGIAG